MERVRQFFSAILAGMLIGMGGTVFLSQSNPVVGSFLFAIGLFTIVVFQLHLEPCWHMDYSNNGTKQPYL